MDRQNAINLLNSNNSFYLIEDYYESNLNGKTRVPGDFEYNLSIYLDLLSNRTNVHQKNIYNNILAVVVQFYLEKFKILKVIDLKTQAIIKYI